jgi:ABC-type transport system involved in multi-copper enzyme maturation permease subunit
VKGGFKKLYLVELRRLWTVAAVFIPLGLLALSSIGLIMSAKFSKSYDVARLAASTNMTTVVPLAAILFGVAMVAADVKEGWLRTLLIRPISRQRYLLIKMAAVYTSVVITILVAGVLPNIIIPTLFFKGEVQFDLLRVVEVHAIVLMQALLIISILALFSCWLPGVFNVVLLGFWWMAASIISALLQSFFWSDKWLSILKEYLFPHGLSRSLDALLGGTSIPYADLSWGLGSLAMFLALAFWSVARIQVDKGSE